MTPGAKKDTMQDERMYQVWLLIRHSCLFVSFLSSDKSESFWVMRSGGDEITMEMSHTMLIITLIRLGVRLRL